MPRSKSSRAWLQRHFRDAYVKRAQKQGARSRAHFKLAEIDTRDKLLRAGMTVVDLGAAPGGWSEYAARRVQPDGRVVAVDLLPIEPISGVDILQGDLTDPQMLDLVKVRLADGADLVISDMAPNMTGIASIDQARSAELVECAIGFAKAVLRPGGSLLVKAFQGAGFDDFVAELRRCFGKAASRKPGASRAESREIYLIARGFTGR